MSNIQRRVPALPPVDQIKDPEARAFCQAIANMMELRNGNIGHTDEERFVTKGEIDQLTEKKVWAMLGASDVTGGPPGHINPPGDDYFNRPPPSSVFKIWEILIKAIPHLTKPPFADLASKTQTAEAGILSEKAVRTTKDTALAQAINTIWAFVGNNGALIQDGALASVDPVAGIQATRWTQVQSEVYPNGITQPSQFAGVRQEMVTTIKNGQPQAYYAIRLDVNGRIAGFGIFNDGNSSFAVNADTFYVGNPGVTGLTSPFYVETSPTPRILMNVPVRIDNGSINQLFSGNFIQSTNYDSSNGWRIDKDGTAVFNQITARGNITANSLTANTVTAGTIAAGAITASNIQFSEVVRVASTGAQSAQVTASVAGGVVVVLADFQGTWDAANTVYNPPTGSINITGAANGSGGSLAAAGVGSTGTITVQVTVGPNTAYGGMVVMLFQR